MFEQDDIELWASATAASSNSIAVQYPYGFQPVCHTIDEPETGHKWPGRIFRPADTEVAQFEFMRRWDGLLRSNA